jgi:hypothetical protein
MACVEDAGPDGQPSNHLRYSPLAMAVFELLARAMIAKASVGGFEVKDLSLIRLSLPIIVAYLFYDTWDLVNARMNYYNVYWAIMDQLHNHITSHGLTDLTLLTQHRFLVLAYTIDPLIR